MGGRGRSTWTFAKPVIVLVLIFLVVSNILLFFLPVPDKRGGIERFFMAPVKLIEYRRSSSEPFWHIDWHREENRVEDKPPFPVPSARALENDLQNPIVKQYVGELINESIARISARGLSATPDLIKGTAYVLMVERVKYVYDNRVDVPSYTIQNGGVCSDWTLVAYALIRAINERYNIKAEYYFLTSDPKWDVGHAFLVVHYPEDDHWEAFDWFATPYLQMPKEDRGNFRFIKVGERRYVFGWFPVGVSETVHFSSLDEMLTVYSLAGGYLKEGYGVTLYRLPDFTRTFYVDVFTLLEEGKPKFQELKSRLKSLRNLARVQQFTLEVRNMGDGSADIINIEFKGDLIVIDVRLKGVNSPLEIKGEDVKVALLSTEGVKIRKWEGVAYVGHYPVYRRLVIVGNIEKLRLGIPYDGEFIFGEITIKELVGKNGVKIEVW